MYVKETNNDILTVRFIETHRLKVRVRLSPFTIDKHLFKIFTKITSQ